MILLPDTGLKEACQVAERIRRESRRRSRRRKIRATALPWSSALPWPTPAGRFSDLEALLAHADAALYKAKGRPQLRWER